MYPVLYPWYTYQMGTSLKQVSHHCLVSLKPTWGYGQFVSLNMAINTKEHRKANILHWNTKCSSYMYRSVGLYLNLYWVNRVLRFCIHRVFALNNYQNRIHVHVHVGVIIVFEGEQWALAVFFGWFGRLVSEKCLILIPENSWRIIIWH